MAIPRNQANAHLPDELQMRIGIPHRGGRLAFHAFNEQYPAMVSASAFWSHAKQEFHIPEATDLSELDFALDSAGFTAMRLFKSKGPQAGLGTFFPWTLAQYVELAATIKPAWWSQPDTCCEPELAGRQEEIDYRVRATATFLEATMRQVYAWQDELAKTCTESVVANLVQPPVPVLQGWSASDYLRSLDLMVQVWERWQPWAAPPALIGLGSVCRRDLRHPTHGLYAILRALEGRIPAASRLHLFGVKGAALKELRTMPWLASADSMAYSFGARVKARKAGISNTLQHQAEEMTQWMRAAAARIKPAAGDQLRIGF